MPYTLLFTNASGDNNFQTAANWYDTNTATAHVAAPATGDTCKFLTGNHAVTNGLSNSAVDLAALEFGSDFTGSIGTAGSALVISVSGTLNYNGRCSICNISAGSADITTIKVQQSASTFYLTGGTTTNLEVGRSGNVYVTSAAVLTNLYGTGGNCQLEYNATPLTLCEWGAGRLECARAATTLEVDGINTIAVMTGTATATTAKVAGGARLNWRSSGTVTTMKAKADSRVDSEGNLAGFAITTLNKYAGSKTFVDEAVSPAVSTTNKIGFN